jgi:hypothetical protein
MTTTGKREASFWSRHRTLKWIVTALAGAVFVLAFVLYLASNLVEDRLLSGATYAEVLRSQKAYERIYTDVLADPALADITKAMLADTKIEGLSDNILALSTSTLRMILPPRRMQAVVEGSVDRLTRYLRGDAPALDAQTGVLSDFDRERLRERISNALLAVLSRFFAEARANVAGAAADVDLTQLRAYMDQIGDGVLNRPPPDFLKAAAGKLPQERRDQIASALLGARAAAGAVRQQVDAALAADDLPGAMALAARERLRDRATAAAERVAQRVSTSDLKDSVAFASAYLNEAETKVIERLNAARGYVTTLRAMQPWLIVFMIVCIIALIWMHGDGLTGALRVAGVTLIAAGLAAIVLWFIIGLILRSEVPTLLDGNLSAVPPATERLIRDVLGAFSAELFGTLFTWAALVAALGVLLIVLANVGPIADALRRMLAPLGRNGWLAVAGVAALFVLALPLVGLAVSAARPKPCNGLVALCDKPVNEVVFPTTHNSMSITQLGWLWPTHDGTLTEQLDYGIRGFLLDTHYFNVGESLRTYMPNAPDAVLEVANRAAAVVGRAPREGTFTCHMICPIGATPLPQLLGEVRAFLEQNPREVLIFAIEDKISPADTAEAFDEAGLTPYIYTHVAGQPWPTLRQMIDLGQRVIVMAEVEGPPPAWYGHVWDNTMETPYSFSSPDQFSCAPNRGGTDKPFFLMNHWIERVSPSRIDAEIVNSYDFLKARALQCAQERGKIPNLIGVNFYLNGDLLKVTDELNTMTVTAR